MNLVEELGPSLPYVRRFAAALTGAQSTGDAYVRRALQLLTVGALDLSDLQPRLALYRLLIETIDLGPLLSRETEAWREAPRNTPAMRALLLTALENFRQEEAASILDISESRVRRLLEEARLQLKSKGDGNVLVIENEPVIALEIAHLVTDLGMTVIGVAATRREAVELARGRRIDLILADIHLADGSSGMDAVNDIRKSAAQPSPVIFVTAFPDRLLRGIKPEPSFLITKPFWPATVRAAVRQALFFGRLDEARRAAG